MENQLIDTGTIQLFELERFANYIGFELHGSSFVRYNGGKNKLLTANRVVSFADMVRLYNNLDDQKLVVVGKYTVFSTRAIRNEDDGVCEGTVGFAVYTKDLEEAYNQQGIVQVKLQASRKQGLIVLSHKIEFYDRDVAEQFNKLVETELKLEDTYAS